MRVSRSLTVADVRFNKMGTESATMLASIAKEKKISLCGITPEQTEANLEGSYPNIMGPADAILLTADLAVRRSLTRVRAFSPQFLCKRSQMSSYASPLTG